MDNDQAFVIALLAIAIPATLSILTLIVVQVFQWKKMLEQRRWEIQDRKEMAKLAAETHSAIVDVGHKAEAAYKEANNVNVKIQSLQDVLAASMQLPQKDITNTDTKNMGG